MARFSVLVLAAGSGQRFGGKESKVFAKLDGQPLFMRALQLFVSRDDVVETILIVSPNDEGTFKTQFGPNIGFMGAKLTVGGPERHESVANGLAALETESDFVAVHDAVRVCLSELWIDDIFAAAVEHGSAVPVTPIVSTLKRVDADMTIGETVPRDGVFAAQTPQVFKRDILQAAYQRLADGEIDAETITDDAQLVAAVGETVRGVRGDARNIKITAKSDLSLAAAVLKTLPRKKVERFGSFEEAKW